MNKMTRVPIFKSACLSIYVWFMMYAYCISVKWRVTRVIQWTPCNIHWNPSFSILIVFFFFFFCLFYWSDQMEIWSWQLQPTKRQQQNLQHATSKVSVYFYIFLYIFLSFLFRRDNFTFLLLPPYLNNIVEYV